MVVGGGGSADSLATPELYDPQSGIWSVTNSLNAGRAYHTTTLLQDGTVLVAGGENIRVIARCELGRNQP